MNAVIYARYSSHSQSEQSIEGQLRDCLAYAKKNKLNIVGEYIDRAFSAKTDNRPNFQKMIKDSEKGLFDTILVWKLDRFARNRYDSATYKNRLRKNGVNVISCMENISDSPEGILIESLLEGMAEYYSAELAQKVTRGMRESALKANFNGGIIPLGYKIVNNKYEIDEATAPIVKKIYEMYADGSSISELCKYLNDKGLKTSRGSSFTFNSFHRMLSNRRYLGIYIYKDIEIEDAIPQIIDNDLFERVQKMMEQNKRTGAKHKAKADYLLSTKLFCGHCQVMMVGESGKGKQGTTYHYYKCSTKKKDSKACDKKTVKKDYIEDLIVNNICKNILQDDIIEQIADKAVEVLAAEQSNDILEALRAQLAETEKALKNIANAIENGIFTKTTKQRLEELEQEKENIEFEIRKEEIALPDFDKDSIIFFLNRMRSCDMTDNNNRKRLINTFVNKIYLYDDKMLITYNFTNKNTDTPEQELLQIMETCSDNGVVGEPLHAVSENLFFYRLSLCQIFVFQ